MTKEITVNKVSGKQFNRASYIKINIVINRFNSVTKKIPFPHSGISPLQQTLNALPSAASQTEISDFTDHHTEAFEKSLCLPTAEVSDKFFQRYNFKKSRVSTSFSICSIQKLKKKNQTTLNAVIKPK